MRSGGNLWWGLLGALAYSAITLAHAENELPDFVAEKALHENAERDHDATGSHLAWGTTPPSRLKSRTEGSASTTRHRWPVKVLSIGHTIASLQDYGSGAPYFHHGLDIRADAGSDVVASVGGKVVNIENYMPSPAYWEVAILDDDGFLWQYHHIDRNSIPQSVWDAFRQGGRVQAGTKIGEVYFWSVVTFGERFHHVHLNILGANKKYLDPFDFLEALPDQDKPEIRRVMLVQNGDVVSGTSVSGAYSVAAEIADSVLSKKLVNPPHWVQVQVDGADPVLVWTFDHLPGESSKTENVYDFYVEGVACGDYECRKPVIDLSFRPGVGGTGAARQEFPRAAGKHTLRVVTADYAGNINASHFEWNVR